MPFGEAVERAALIGADFPGAEVERDRVEIDAAHAVTEGGRVADLLQRVAAFEAFDGRRGEGFVEVVVGGAPVIDDVLIARDADLRCRERDGTADEEADARADEDVACAIVVAAVVAAVVDQHHFPAAGIAAVAVEKAAMAVGDVVDAHAAATGHEGGGGAVRASDAYGHRARCGGSVRIRRGG